MAKRFTDNEKWKKTFFKGLSTVNKLFFLYILDECDNAGVWHVEVDIAEIRIGETVDLNSAKKELGKHIHEFDNGEKWFIPFFIDFQYGVLNENVNAHKSVIIKLEKRKLTKIYQQFINCSLSNKNKVKVKSMDKYKDINKEVLSYFRKWLKYRKEIKKAITNESTYELLVERFNSEPVEKIKWVQDLLNYRECIIEACLSYHAYLHGDYTFQHNKFIKEIANLFTAHVMNTLSSVADVSKRVFPKVIRYGANQIMDAFARNGHDQADLKVTGKTTTSDAFEMPPEVTDIPTTPDTVETGWNFCATLKMNRKRGRRGKGRPNKPPSPPKANPTFNVNDEERSLPLISNPIKEAVSVESTLLTTGDFEHLDCSTYCNTTDGLGLFSLSKYSATKPLVDLTKMLGESIGVVLLESHKIKMNKYVACCEAKIRELACASITRTRILYDKILREKSKIIRVWIELILVNSQIGSRDQIEKSSVDKAKLKLIANEILNASIERAELGYCEAMAIIFRKGYNVNGSSTKGLNSLLENAYADYFKIKIKKERDTMRNLDKFDFNAIAGHVVQFVKHENYSEVGKLLRSNSISEKGYLMANTICTIVDIFKGLNKASQKNADAQAKIRYMVVKLAGECLTEQENIQSSLLEVKKEHDRITEKFSDTIKEMNREGSNFIMQIYSMFKDFLLNKEGGTEFKERLEMSKMLKETLDASRDGYIELAKHHTDAITKMSKDHAIDHDPKFLDNAYTQASNIIEQCTATITQLGTQSNINEYIDGMLSSLTHLADTGLKFVAGAGDQGVSSSPQTLTHNQGSLLENDVPAKNAARTDSDNPNRFMPSPRIPQEGDASTTTDSKSNIPAATQ